MGKTSILAHVLQEVELDGIKSSNEHYIVEKYLTDESSGFKGNADKVLFPETEEEVSAILKHAQKEKIPVSISGGGTGITGSRVPTSGGWVLSTENLIAVRNIPQMDAHKIEYDSLGKKIILYLDEENAKVIAPPGISIGDLTEIIKDKGFIYPPNPTEWSALLGGNIATNASGGRSFKFGAIRKWVTRLRVILPTGELLDIKRGEVFADQEGIFVIEMPYNTELKILIPNYNMPKVKNASGYFTQPGMDLIDLFIGSEGTLGVYTEIEMKLERIPGEIFGSIVFFPSMAHAVKFIKTARERSRNPEDPLDAITLDFFDEKSLELMRGEDKNIPRKAKSAVFFEQYMVGEDPDQSLMPWIELMEEMEYMEDWSGMTEKDRMRLKDFRHSLPETVNTLVRSRGVQKLGMDLSVPDDYLEEMIRVYTEIGGGSGIDYVLFGHIGDNNLHFNFLSHNKEELEKAKKVYLQMARKGIEMGGTVSAEHGVGKKKYQDEEGREYPYLHLMYGDRGMKESARLKLCLDPSAILNRENIVSKEYYCITIPS